MLRIYTLANCDTCRRAVKWLRAHAVAFEEKAIRATPPKPAELRAVLAAVSGERARLFNRSGAEYRALKLGDTLPQLDDAAALALLAANGNLVKRPVAVGPGVALVGFDPAAWAGALLQK